MDVGLRLLVEEVLFKLRSRRRSISLLIRSVSRKLEEEAELLHEEHPGGGAGLGVVVAGVAVLDLSDLSF